MSDDEFKEIRWHVVILFVVAVVVALDVFIWRA